MISDSELQAIRKRQEQMERDGWNESLMSEQCGAIPALLQAITELQSHNTRMKKALEEAIPALLSGKGIAEVEGQMDEVQTIDNAVALARSALLPHE